MIARPDKLVVITDIGLDHTEILGDTLEGIAAQKAGIVQPGNVVLIQGGQQPAVLSVLVQTAQARGASRVEVVENAESAAANDDTPLFQHRNWVLAQAVVDTLAHREGLKRLGEASRGPPQAYLPPGRMEILRLDDQHIILDGAHNPQKLTTLAESLAHIGIRQLPVLAALGRSTETKVAACLDVISTFASPLTITDFAIIQDMERRSWPADELVVMARQQGITTATAQVNNQRALDALISRPDRHLLITGSLYLLAELRSHLFARGAHTSTISTLRGQVLES